MEAESNERELIGFALAQAVTAARLALVGVVIIAVVAWQGVGPVGTLAWAGLVTTCLLLRNQVLIRSVRAPVQNRGAAKARRSLQISSVLLALSLGTLPMFGLPHMPTEARFVLTLFYCCWGAAGMSSLGVLPSLYAVYLGLMLAGVAVGWLSASVSEAALAICGGLLMYWLVLCMFARGFGRRVAEGIAIRAENALLVRQLSAANEAKTRFIMTASHDLRQPLHAIGLLAGVLARARSAEDLENARAALGVALEGLHRLFSAILDLSRLDSGVLRPQVSYVAVDLLIARLDVEYRALCMERGRRWECRSERAYVQTDGALLERILRNLLDNAFKHGGQGDVCLALTVGDMVTVEVSDTGPGIPSSEMERVFDEFYRGSESGPGGLGLGLSIVRRLAWLLNADLRIGHTDESQSTGTRVRLALPAARPEDAMGLQADTPPPDIAGLHVLVLDDETTVLEATRALLEQWGCVVATSRSRDEAHAAARSLGTPQVALTDYRLGANATGLDALEIVRRAYPDMGIVVITGESDPTVRRQLEESGLPVLEKPVDPKELRLVLGLFCSVD